MNLAKHHHKRRGLHKKQNLPAPRKKAIRFMDKIIYLGGVLVPLTLLPQVLKIWVNKNASGVSIVSWIAFLGGATFWLTYGILHREKPIIFMYITMLLLEILIIIGILLYG